MAAGSTLRWLGPVLVCQATLVVVGAALAFDGRGVVAPGVIVALVVVAAVLVAVGITFRWVGVVAAGAVAEGAAYCLARVGQPLSVGGPAAFGVVLLGVLWFGALAIECREPVSADHSRRRRRAWEGLVAVVMGIMAASVVALAADAGRGVGVLLFLAGAGAALGIVAVVWTAARPKGA